MRKSRFTEEQITYALRQAEAGTPVEEICRKLGVAEATFYRWKKKYGVLTVNSESRREFTTRESSSEGCTEDSPVNSPTGETSWDTNARNPHPTREEAPTAFLRPGLR